MGESTVVKVERRHIEAGKRNDPEFCPVALAVNELDEMEKASVGEGYCHFTLSESLTPKELPGPVCGFFGLEGWIMRKIERFDETGEMEPFRFHLIPPDPNDPETIAGVKQIANVLDITRQRVSL